MGPSSGDDGNKVKSAKRWTPRLASMGPSSGDDGNRPGYCAEIEASVVASMGPSSGDDGNAAVESEGAHAENTGFNGAVVW